MSKIKMVICCNCGEELGMGEVWPDDVEHCGKRECAREASNILRQQQDEARHAAEEDDYARYK